jgi:hypothetical protein
VLVPAVLAFALLSMPAPPLGAGADPASVRALEAALQRGHARIRELQEAPLAIVAVRRLYESEPGGTARVLLVDTDRGEMIAKVSYVRTAGNRMVPWILQDHASRGGFAPAIHKVIEGGALARLYRDDPLLAGLRSPWADAPDSPPLSMVVMDVVRDGFSFMQWTRSGRSLEGYPPSLVPVWTARLHAIEDFLNRHNVQMVDEQFLIQPDGNVAVIDFDHYTFVDSQRRRWAYTGVTTYPDLDYWRVPTPDAKLNDVESNVRVLLGLFPSRGSRRSTNR